MKIMKKIFCILLCLALCAGLAACEKEEPVSSQPESSAPSTVSSQPEPEPESSRFVPAPDLIPSSDVGEDPFEDAFSQNPIDKKYDEAYNLASSFSMMRQACNEAAGNWEAMVKVAFRSALEVTLAEEKDALQAEQDDWEAGLDTLFDEIQEAAGEGNEGVLTAAREIVLVYRERAKVLCKIKYKADGVLPEFPDPDAEVSAVG